MMDVIVQTRGGLVQAEYYESFSPKRVLTIAERPDIMPIIFIAAAGAVSGLLGYAATNSTGVALVSAGAGSVAGYAFSKAIEAYQEAIEAYQESKTAETP